MVTLPNKELFLHHRFSSSLMPPLWCVHTIWHRNLILGPINNVLDRIVCRFLYCTETDINTDSHWVLYPFYQFFFICVGLYLGVAQFECTITTLIIARGSVTYQFWLLNEYFQTIFNLWTGTSWDEVLAEVLPFYLMPLFLDSSFWKKIRYNVCVEILNKTSFCNLRNYLAFVLLSVFFWRCCPSLCLIFSHLMIMYSKYLENVSCIFKCKISD